jgi:sugar (pentulose or hexulose) kinase
MSSRIVVSIDSSTTACKALAWDARGTALAEGRAAYPLRQPHPGWREQDAEDWWAGACAALRDCLAQIDTRQVDALAITHQRETFVPVDAAGAPIGPAILWNDERSPSQVRSLEHRFGGDALHRLTGKPPSMTASISKLLWLVENEPALAAQTARFLDVHAFLVHRLTGCYRTSLANADPLGLLDMARRTWADDLIRELGLRPDQFVELVEPGARIGQVTAAAAAATGLPAGLPVIAGAGDGHCAGLGANVTAPGRAYLNLGTGIASGAFSPDYLCDRAFRTLIAPVPGAYYAEHILRGGRVHNCVVCRTLCRRPARGRPQPLRRATAGGCRGAGCPRRGWAAACPLLEQCDEPLLGPRSPPASWSAGAACMGGSISTAPSWKASPTSSGWSATP